MTAAAGADRSTDSYLPAHGNGGYRVEHYDLDLDYRVGPNRLSGDVTVSAVATQALSALSLDFADLRVRRVLVDGEPAKFGHRAGKLRVRPRRAIADGARFEVRVRYAGNPRPVRGQWGDIGWDELTEGSLVASQPIGAPSWFPCNDHPSDKAAYRVSVTADAGFTVLVTGDLLSRRTSGAGSTRWVYERAEPTPTYLMGVHTGRYEEVELAAGPVPQRAAVPAHLLPVFRETFGRHGEIMRVLGELFGPYPFAEYVVVITDDDLEEPIEAQGLSVFGRNLLDGHRTHERLVVHELAHQWFGNSLTLGDWRDIWLNEGFATYAEWLWSEAVGEGTAAEHAREWHARMRAAEPGLRVADPGVARMFDEGVYKRGALVLHALRGELGDDAFFGLLRRWVAEHRHATVSTAEFTALAEQCAARPLEGLFETWLHGTETPADSGF
ncbi:M1 family metallopeptidase [Saccharopolyspora gloriosae]|uniref:Aminopeptidase N n=1 Tax=Saccharopolyspora gloriosae TaxID=455344 RepID=A0A840NFZ8_9PSEU|nr:M1 family metallopeptidase [Saccharopolyspora gloriosae]MBB5069178.1 aminopeptidase N [Saccharopolyspora gloriosae]